MNVKYFGTFCSSTLNTYYMQMDANTSWTCWTWTTNLRWMQFHFKCLYNSLISNLRFNTSFGEWNSVSKNKVFVFETTGTVVWCACNKYLWHILNLNILEAWAVEMLSSLGLTGILNCGTFWTWTRVLNCTFRSSVLYTYIWRNLFLLDII